MYNLGEQDAYQEHKTKAYQFPIGVYTVTHSKI